MQVISPEPVKAKTGKAPKKAPSHWDKIDEDDIIDTMQARAAIGRIH